MIKRTACITVTLFATILLATSAQANGVRIFLVGDSTMSDRAGYGRGFCGQFKKGVKCTNLAQMGASSKSFRADGFWRAAIDKIKGDSDKFKTYVWIEFAHNDGSSDLSKHTDLKNEFPQNISVYCDEIRAAGAIPVLATPLTQRHFTSGSLHPDLEPWASAIRQVAKAKGVKLVDLYTASQAAVQTMGPARANQLAIPPIPNNVLVTQTSGTSVKPDFSAADKSKGFDYTHLGPQGSQYFGKLAADLWAQNDEDIRPYEAVR